MAEDNKAAQLAWTVSRPPMIVSHNRYGSIEKYGNSLRAADPMMWGAIMPWEFPQNGTRAEEEAFLRQWFTDEEIHLQGGVGDEWNGGAGFRFLKQVWYCQAIWNFEHRVPALHDWWWAHSDTAKEINDPRMQGYFLKDDVEPITFFQREDMEMYGDAFLRHVIPMIKHTARLRIEQLKGRQPKQQPEEQPKQQKEQQREQPKEQQAPSTPAVNGLIKRSMANVPQGTSSAPPTAALTEASDMPELQKVTSQPVGAKTTMTSPVELQKVSSQPAGAKTTTTSPVEGPQGAPVPPAALQIPRNEEVPPTNTAVVNPRTISSEHQFSVDRIVPGHRGGGGARGNQRGGAQSKGRKSFSSQQHNQDGRSQFQHNTPNVPAYQYGYQQLVPPGGQSAFPPNHQQGPPVVAEGTSRYHSSAPHPPFDGFNHPPSHFTPGQEPHVIWAPDSFAGRGGLRGDFSRGFNPEPFPGSDANFAYPQHNHNPYDPQHSYIPGHGQPGSRGGNHRGQAGHRGGRGGRGSRNSFGMNDKPRFIQGTERTPSNDFPAGAPYPKGRRASTFGERNWRSANDRPQFQPEHDGHENAALKREPSHYPPNMYNNYGAWQTPDQFMAHAPPVEPPRSVNEMPIPNSNPSDPIYHCTAESVGERCTYANKLAVFNVPMDLPDQELHKLFGSFGQIEHIGRMPQPLQSPAHQTRFVVYKDAAGARDCLLHKPATWLHPDRPLHVEVSREFWDADHPRFKFHPGYQASFGQDRTYAGPGQAESMYSRKPVHRFQNSTDTIRGAVAEGSAVGQSDTNKTTATPTASGASTPRKGNKSNKNKSNARGKNKGSGEEPRKTSLASNMNSQVGSEASRSGGDSAVFVRDGKAPEAQADKTASHQPALKLATDNNATESKKQRSTSESTVRQTTSEPAFTPVDKVQTKIPLPQPDTRKDEATVPSDITTDATVSPKDTQTVTDRVEATAGSSGSDVPSKVADTEQLFREDKAKQTTQAENVNDTTTEKSSKPHGPAGTSAATASNINEEHVDDSFHTATGTPPSGHDKVPRDSVDIQPEDAEAVKHDSSELLEQDAAKKGVEIAITPASPTLKAPPSPSKAPQLTLDTETALTAQAYQAANHASSDNAVAPVSAYVTAPNTPAITQDSGGQDEKATEEKKNSKPVKTEAAQPAKDAPKAKGPSQTESLSLFGKRSTVKKAKPKRGTIKGKPKGGDVGSSDAGSSATSRVVSRATTPSQSAVDQDVDGQKGGKENQKIPKPAKAVAKVGSKADQDKSADEPSTTSAKATPVKDSSSTKKNSLGQMFHGLFHRPGAVPNSTSVEQTLTAQDRSNDALTDVKATASNLEKDTDDVEPDDKSAALKSIDNGSVASTEAVANGHAEATTDLNGDDPAHVTGLGITGGDVASEGAVTVAKNKNKKNKAKKKAPQKEAADNASETTATPDPTPEATPEPEGSEYSNSRSPFRFDFHNHSMVGPASDAGPTSDTSSQTVGQDTPSSSTNSPEASASLKALRKSSGRTGPSHLLEAKQQTWKRSKPRPSPKSSSSGDGMDFAVEQSVDLDKEMSYVLRRTGKIDREETPLEKRLAEIAGASASGRPSSLSGSMNDVFAGGSTDTPDAGSEATGQQSGELSQLKQTKSGDEEEADGEVVRSDANGGNGAEWKPKAKR